MAGRQVSLFYVVLGVIIGVVRGPGIPPPVSVSSLVDYDRDPFKEYDWCPVINMKGYMQHMATYVADKKPEAALVVVGAKNAGKTKGILTMIDLWKKAGHIVLDIDLKGKPEGISSSEVLKSVAWQLYDTIKGDEFFQLRKYYLHNCSKEPGKTSDSYSLIQWIIGSIIGSAILGTLIIKKLSNYWNSAKKDTSDNEIKKDHPDRAKKRDSPDYDEDKRKNSRDCAEKDKKDSLDCFQWNLLYWSLASLVVFVSFGVFLHIDGAGRIMEIHDPLYDKISSGDWEMLQCVCNGISTHNPEMRPILIVREFATLEDKSCNDLLRSLEKFKQKNIILFPVILETSDFMWLNSSSLIKSSLSFESYYLKEFSFEDGVSELVNGYKMWNHDQFAMIYEAIGGHGGSYSYLWRLMKKRNYSIEEAIRYMKEEAYAHLIVCIRTQPQSTNDAYYRFIWNLRLKKFKYNLKNSDVPRHVVYHFATCNLVFLDKADTVYPQNRLLLHAITKCLDEDPFDDPAENSTQVTEG